MPLPLTGGHKTSFTPPLRARTEPDMRASKAELLTKAPRNLKQVGEQTVADRFNANVAAEQKLRLERQVLTRELESTNACLSPKRLEAQLRKLAGQMATAGASEQAIHQALLTENAKKGERPLGQPAVKTIAADAYALAVAKVPETAKVVHLKTVKPEAVTWLWPGRIPGGKLTLVIGDPKVGKSFMTLDLAARVSTGRPWPTGEPSTQGNVVMLAAEDALKDTVRPRVNALKGDPARFYVIQGVDTAEGERWLSLDRDMAKLEAVVKAHRPALVVIDPLSAYLGKADSFKDSEVRAVLGPLALLAETYQTAILAVMHLTKDAKRSVLYRAPGSIGFAAQARAILTVGQNNEDDEPDRRVVAWVAVTNGKLPDSRAFTLTDDGLEWEKDAADITARELLADRTPRRETEVDRAIEFLKDYLKDGPRNAQAVLAAGNARGFSEPTLRRARQRLGIEPEQMHKGRRITGWQWALPEEGGDL